MTPGAQPAALVFPTAFGLVMVAPIAAQAHGPALMAALLGAIAVAVGIRSRPAATLAVLLTVSAIALSDTPPVLVGLSGLAATAYLVLRHAAGMQGLVTATQPTVVGAVTFTIAGLAATSFTPQLPWLPLLAPIAVFGIYAVVTRPFWTKPGRG